MTKTNKKRTKTMTTFIDLVYSLTDNTKHGLEQAKENGVKLYKLAKQRYQETPTEQFWQDFCVCKSICMQLGCRI